MMITHWLDTPRIPCYFPTPREGWSEVFREACVSTTSRPTRLQAWLPRPYGNEGWPPSFANRRRKGRARMAVSNYQK